jgi:hypothetical protein
MSIEAKYPSSGPPVQGSNEQVRYFIDVSEWSESLNAASVTEVIDESDGTNVIDTVMPCDVPGACNEVVAEWPMITLPLLGNLTAGRSYRVQVQFTADGGQTLETHLRVKGL